MFSPTVKISEEFVKKCDYLCKKISKLEWSGVLFYELLNQNSKDLSDLVFEVKDIYLLDIGTAGFALSNNYLCKCAVMNFEDKEKCYPFAPIYFNYGHTITCRFLRFKKRQQSNIY